MRKLIALAVLLPALIAQLALSTAVFAEEGSLGDTWFNIQVEDATDRKFLFNTEFSGDSFSASKSFNGTDGKPPLLSGNSYLAVDIVENEKVSSAMFKFTKETESGIELAAEGELDVSNGYPGLVKSKNRYLTTMQYDVSKLAANSEDWTDKNKVYSTPLLAKPVYKDARISTSFTSGSSFPFYTLSTKSDAKTSYTTNTAFMYGMSTPDYMEASKHWGYIKFPGAGEYYLGSVSKDGSGVFILDDRADSPNAADLTGENGNSFWINDNFDFHVYQFNTTNKPFIVREEDKDWYFPVYIDYFNGSKSGELLLVYDTKPFIVSQLNHGEGEYAESSSGSVLKVVMDTGYAVLTNAVKTDKLVDGAIWVADDRSYYIGATLSATWQPGSKWGQLCNFVETDYLWVEGSVDAKVVTYWGWVSIKNATRLDKWEEGSTFVEEKNAYYKGVEKLGPFKSGNWRETDCYHGKEWFVLYGSQWVEGAKGLSIKTVELDTLAGIKSALGSSVEAVPAEWFYASSADGSSESVRGVVTGKIPFPTEHGTYYATVTETLISGKVKEVVLGPFEIGEQYFLGSAELENPSSSGRIVRDGRFQANLEISVTAANVDSDVVIELESSDNTNFRIASIIGRPEWAVIDRSDNKSVIISGASLSKGTQTLRLIVDLVPLPGKRTSVGDKVSIGISKIDGEIVDESWVEFTIIDSPTVR